MHARICVLEYNHAVCILCVPVNFFVAVVNWLGKYKSYQCTAQTCCCIGPFSIVLTGSLMQGSGSLTGVCNNNAQTFAFTTNYTTATNLYPIIDGQTWWFTWEGNQVLVNGLGANNNVCTNNAIHTGAGYTRSVVWGILVTAIGACVALVRAVHYA